MKGTICLLAILLLSANLMAQAPVRPVVTSKLEILVSDGEIENDLFVLRKPTAADTVVPKVLKAADQTFIGESAQLFTYVQNYLFHTGRIKAVEPPRLAITPRQGCFGVMGFILDENGKKVKMPTSGYVDLNAGMFTTQYDHLQSITQLFPHEMGHVIQMYLCSGTTDKEPQSISPGIHYFNIITGYNTAFSEGFAEHFENVARKLEPSAEVKAGIYRDIEQKRKELPRYISGFNRDYKLPLRIGFYRAITPLWFQQLENLKRYELVENGQIKYLNSTIQSENVSNAMLYRNTGVQQDVTRLRNAAQAASTEGVVSAFFSALVLSPLALEYQQPDFYRPFLSDSVLPVDVRQQISPLHNQYMKIFRVMNGYVKTNTTGRGQLYDFVAGYITEFPGEKDQVMQILRTTTGVTSLPDSLPEIWLLNTDFKYKFWVMAQFGLTLPYYAFNLNTADGIDLQTFQGISKADAEAILRFREEQGFFKSLSDIRKVSGLSETAKSTLLASAYNEKNVPAYSGRPNFMSLLYLPLPHLFGMMLVWFVLILIMYLYLIRDFRLTAWQKVRKSLVQLVKFLLLGLMALVCIALFSFGWQFYVGLGLFILAVKALILRNKRQARNLSLITTAIMLVLILYSVF